MRNSEVEPWVMLGAFSLAVFTAAGLGLAMMM